jgi:hypothetical protein
MNNYKPNRRNYKSGGNTRRPAGGTKPRNNDRKFLELVYREVVQTVDNNTPFDWGEDSKGALKKSLFQLFEAKCKDSFKNGIEVGYKKAGGQGSPWAKPKQGGRKQSTIRDSAHPMNKLIKEPEACPHENGEPDTFNQPDTEENDAYPHENGEPEYVEN